MVCLCELTGIGQAERGDPGFCRAGAGWGTAGMVGSNEFFHAHDGRNSNTAFYE